MNTGVKNYIGGVYTSDGSKVKDLHFEASEAAAIRIAGSEFDKCFTGLGNVTSNGNIVFVSSSEGFVKLASIGAATLIHAKVK